MAKIDLKKELKPLYTASAQQATLVTGWPLQYLMVNGYGDPDTNPDFPAGVEALYTASYALKFSSRRIWTWIGWCRPWRASGGC